MQAVDFIKETASDELIKNHLKLVFETYYQLFGKVCTGCPAKIAGYIRSIKNYEEAKTMEAQTTAQFQLKDKAVIVVPGSNIAYSNANLTDTVAIAFLKKNINRMVLFKKLPEDLESLLQEPASLTNTQEEITLEDYTIGELRTMFPEAKGKSKVAVINAIKDLQNSYIETEMDALEEEE